MQQFINYFQNRSEVIFRVMLSLIFIVAGGNHLFATTSVSQRLQNSELGAWITAYFPPELLVVLAGIGLTAGGISLLVGFLTRWSALFLLFILVPITITVQLQGMETLGPLFKNIGLMGGLIHFLANGSMHYSIDGYITQKSTLTS
ncbi:MAG: DoxX family protein [Bacteroidota bacterium]